MHFPSWKQSPAGYTNSRHEEQEIGLLDSEEKQSSVDDLQASANSAGRLASMCSRARALLCMIYKCTPRIDCDNLKPAWLRKPQERKLHPTSYLDGLRGAAAFFVFIHHSSLAFYPDIRPGYGTVAPEGRPVNHDYPIQLPFLRLVFSGSAMVDIFFVISGAVLSLKPLRLIRQGEHEKLLENLSSSTFRRGPRLFIPCFVSTFFTALASMLGFMLQDGITRRYPLSATHSWIEEYSVWLRSMVQFVRPNAIGTEFEQNLWTIPMEFRGSLLVFLCALGVAKVRSPWLRTLSLTLLNIYWFYIGWWENFLFLSGMLVSELSLYRHAKPSHHTIIKTTHCILAVLAIYMLSMPEKGEDLAHSTYGYGWIHENFSPASWAGNQEPGRFWPCFGAILFVGLQSHAGPDSSYQRLFTTRFIQYLGKVSFSFYLWHGLVIFTVGARVMTMMTAKFGSEGGAWWLSICTTYLAMLPTLFWISDLSTVYVDKAVVNLGKRLMDL